MSVQYIKADVLNRLSTNDRRRLNDYFEFVGKVKLSSDAIINDDYITGIKICSEYICNVHREILEPSLTYDDVIKMIGLML